MRLLLAIIALSLTAEFNLVGRVTLAEMILLVCAAVALFRAGPMSRNVKVFYLLALLWFVGAAISDLYNLSDFEDIARGWAKIAFLVVSFTALRILAGNNQMRVILFIYFLFVAGAIRTALGISDERFTGFIFGTAWRFGYGQLFSASVFLVSAWLLHTGWSRILGVIMPFGAAALALFLNARNLTGLTALAGMASALTAGRRKPIATSRVIAIGIAGLLAGIVVINVYEYAASEGLLGEDARAKYLTQTQGSLNILLAGRTESLASTQAIMDAPVLGHGSWARNIEYVMILRSRLEAAGVRPQGNIKSDLIPSHSHLLGAWVEHGIFGALFWVWAIFITMKGLLVAIQRPSPLTGFVMFIGLSLLWDILFSPFGLERRVIVAAWLYLMILYAERGSAVPVPNASRTRFLPPKVRKVGI